jgi:hypothetical protein
MGAFHSLSYLPPPIIQNSSDIFPTNGSGIQVVLLKALRKQNVPQAKGLQARRLYAPVGG